MLKFSFAVDSFPVQCITQGRAADEQECPTTETEIVPPEAQLYEARVPNEHTGNKRRITDCLSPDETHPPYLLHLPTAQLLDFLNDNIAQ